MESKRETLSGAGSKDSQRTPAPCDYDVTACGIGKKEVTSLRSTLPNLKPEPDPNPKPWLQVSSEYASPAVVWIGEAKRKTLDGMASEGGGPDVGPGTYDPTGMHHRRGRSLVPGTTAMNLEFSKLSPVIMPEEQGMAPPPVKQK